MGWPKFIAAAAGELREKGADLDLQGGEAVMHSVPLQGDQTKCIEC